MSGDPQETMDDSDRLKPCPFCGGSASAGFIGGDGDNAGGHYIECDKCGASTNLRFSCGEDARPLLIEQWNTRKGKPIPLDDESLAACVLLLHRMLEAPTSQISVGWKNAIGPALLALKA